MDAREIRSLLPHRYPFLMVDNITDMNQGESCIGEKKVTLNEPCYANVTDSGDGTELHYPISLQLESFAQVGALLVLSSRKALNVNESFVMLAGSVRGMKILSAVEPGNTLVHKVKIVKELTDTVVIGGEIFARRNNHSNDQIVGEVGSMVIAVRPREGLMPEHS